MWLERADEFQEAWDDGNRRKAFSLLKVYSGRMKGTPPIVENGGQLVTGEKPLEVWKNYFQQLLNRAPPTLSPLPHAPWPLYDALVSPPSTEEVKKVIDKMNNGKSPGDDVIPAEVLKALPPPLSSLHPH